VNKYRNISTTVDGIKFASKREAMHYILLRQLERAGKIKNLKRQVPFKLVDEITYRADFTYEENGKLVVDDPKGYQTREFKRKMRLMKQQHGIEVRCV
jgi:hypothetical protein